MGVSAFAACAAVVIVMWAGAQSGGVGQHDEVEDDVGVSHARHHVTPSGAFCCRRGERIVVEVGAVSFQIFLGLLGGDPEEHVGADGGAQDRHRRAEELSRQRQVRHEGAFQDLAPVRPRREAGQ